MLTTVPEYDVVSPFHSNDDGEFVSFNLRDGGRQRRSLNDLNRPNYKLRAFGKDLHLKLVRNDRLMAPGLQFEEKLASGQTLRSPAPENTFYLGHVASDPDSLVAVSNGEGLVTLQTDLLANETQSLQDYYLIWSAHHNNRVCLEAHRKHITHTDNAI